MNNGTIPVYEISVCYITTWVAHSLSNRGSDGTNRLYPRRQFLADGAETDAISGSIAKRSHAIILAEQLESAGQELCPACARRDSRRAGAIDGNRSMTEILGCGLCDVHGFLVPAKKAGNGNDERQRRSKHSLIDFSFGLALPASYSESDQLFTRFGDEASKGQMLMKATGRSGKYATCIRYTSVGIGVDTNSWQTLINDETVRRIRHQAVLSALCDQMLSPTGAMTAKLLPHLTGICGAIVLRKQAGRAPIYSPLESDFVEKLKQLSSSTQYEFYRFDDIAEFQKIMDHLIENSYPCTPGKHIQVDTGSTYETE